MGNVYLNLNGVETFEKASGDSATSGEELLGETINLENAVTALRATFEGNGARAYENFMVLVNQTQNQLAEALGLINEGQAELYKTFVAQEDESTDNATRAIAEAESVGGNGKLMA